MKRWVISVGVLTIPALLLFAGSELAHAELGSIGAAPAYPRQDNKRSNNIFIHQIKGGQSADDGIKIYNYTGEARTVEVRAVDSVLASDGSFSCRQAVEKKKDVGAWTKLESEKVTVPAKSNATVKFTVEVPTTASPGEHNGCITVQDSQNFASNSGGGVQLGFRTAIRMAITVAGDLIKQLSIIKIDINRVKGGSYTVSPVAKNTGNVSLDVTARAQLRDVFGRKTELKTAQYPIISNATTGWAFEFKRPFWGGFHQAYVSLAYDADPNSGLGEANGQQKRISQKSAYFFMLPDPRALAIEVALLLLIVALPLLWFIRRKRKRTAQTELANQQPVPLQKKEKRPKKVGWQPYIVKEGDTIISLASKTEMHWKKLAKKNKIRAPFIIQPGQVLTLPPIRASSIESSSVTETQEQSMPSQVHPTNPEREKPSIGPTHTESSLSWTSPRESTTNSQRDTMHQTQFPEYYQTHKTSEYESPEAGWTSPLAEPRGYIDDTELVPELRDMWNDPELRSGKSDKEPKPKKAGKTKHKKKKQ